MDTIYRKVEIKSEQDLPKEIGRYISCFKELDITKDFPFYKTKVSIRLWLEKVDWYLQPIDPQEPKQSQEKAIKVTDEEIGKQANLHFEENTSDNAIWRGGAKWLRDKLKTNLREEFIKFAQQFYADEETCIHNVDQYLKLKRTV